MAACGVEAFGQPWPMDETRSRWMRRERRHATTLTMPKSTAAPTKPRRQRFDELGDQDLNLPGPECFQQLVVNVCHDGNVSTGCVAKHLEDTIAMFLIAKADVAIREVQLHAAHIQPFDTSLHFFERVLTLGIHARERNQTGRRLRGFRGSEVVVLSHEAVLIIGRCAGAERGHVSRVHVRRGENQGAFDSGSVEFVQHVCGIQRGSA